MPRGRPKIGVPVFTRLRPETKAALLLKCKAKVLKKMSEGVRAAVEAWVLLGD